MLNLTLLFFIITINSFAFSFRRIIGGKNADISEFPYQVSLRDASNDEHFCGGSILNESFIVTAAHCMYDDKMKALNQKDFFVVVGQTELSLHSSSVKRQIQTIIIHPFYGKATFRNDIALLKLTELLPLLGFIKPIRLNNQKVVKGLQCFVTGWGSLIYDEVADKGIGTSDILQKAEFKTLTLDSCRKILGKSAGMYVTRRTFCAEGVIGKDGRPVDSCQGDSGGPMVCNGNLTGIVSIGIGCGIPEHPGIYTDVQQHSPWIQYQVASSAKRFYNNSLYLLLLIAIKS